MLLELDKEVAGSLWAFSLLNFEPVVGDFAGEVFEECGVGSQEVECAVIVAFAFEDQEVVLPKRLLVTQVNQRPFIQRVDKLNISGVLDKIQVVFPHLIASLKRSVLIRRSQLA